MTAASAVRDSGDRRSPRVCVGAHVEALLAGDFSHGLSGFAEDVVWHVPGGGELGGEHRGREAVLALIERLLAPGYRRGHIAFRSITEHDGYSFEWVDFGAPTEPASVAFPLVSRIESGRIREVWWCGKKG